MLQQKIFQKESIGKGNKLELDEDELKKADISSLKTVFTGYNSFAGKTAQKAAGISVAKKYSLGMKQRLGLAGALLGRPPILILDEPTNGLDPSGIHEIRNLVKSLPSLYDCTVLISSHMLSEIELIADDIGILNHGRLLFEGSMNDLRQYALQSGFAADNLEDVFLSMVEKDNMDRKQRAKL